MFFIYTFILNIFYIMSVVYRPIRHIQNFLLVPSALALPIGHKLISVAFKLAPAIAGLKFIYINLFTIANLF